MLEISNCPLAPTGWICWGQAESLRRLPPGQSEILEHEIIYSFHVYLKVLHVHCKLINNKMLPCWQLKTLNSLNYEPFFRSSGLGKQCRPLSDLSGKQHRPDLTNKGLHCLPLCLHILSHIYIHVKTTLITTFFHEEPWTIDHNVMGLILTCGLVLCRVGHLSQLPIVLVKPRKLS